MKTRSKNNTQQIIVQRVLTNDVLGHQSRDVITVTGTARASHPHIRAQHSETEFFPPPPTSPHPQSLFLRFIGTHVVSKTSLHHVVSSSA